jgi:hypothetical protein
VFVFIVLEVRQAQRTEACSLSEFFKTPDQKLEPETSELADFFGGAMSDQTKSTNSAIVRAAIYPAIGVARVGNSQSEFFFGPEVVHPASESPGFYKDATGALKRQAVRFRIHGYDAAGEVVAELTANNADISWTAQGVAPSLWPRSRFAACRHALAHRTLWIACGQSR